MLYHDRIDASGGIDINKTCVSKACDFCRCVYFLDKGFKFQKNVCNGGHDVLMMSINLSDITVTNIKSVDYRCIITRISKSETINLMQNTDLSEKNGT